MPWHGTHAEIRDSQGHFAPVGKAERLPILRQTTCQLHDPWFFGAPPAFGGTFRSHVYRRPCGPRTLFGHITTVDGQHSRHAKPELGKKQATEPTRRLL